MAEVAASPVARCSGYLRMDYGVRRVALLADGRVLVERNLCRGCVSRTVDALERGGRL